MLSSNPLSKDVKTIKGKLTDLKNIKNKKIVVFSGSLQLQSQYLNSAYSTPFANGFYSTIGVSGKLSLFNLPLTAGVTLNFHNDQFRADYTAFNIGFDANGWKEGLKNNYLNYIKSLPNYFGNELGQELNHFEDSLKNYDKYRNILSSPDYYNQLNSYSKEAQLLKDSLIKVGKDTLTTIARDSLNQDSTYIKAQKKYKYLNDTISKLKHIADEYADMEKYKKQNQDYVKMLGKYHDYIDMVKNTSDITKIPGVESTMKKAGIWDKKTSIISGIQKMGIGRVSLDLSRYTIQSQSIYGFNIDYLFRKALYAGIGLGFAAPYSFSFSTNSLLTNNPINKFDFHRLVGYVRIGYGAIAENHVHLIWTSYGDRFTAAANNNNVIASPYSPPANSVLAIEFLENLSKSLKLTGELATSNSSFMNRLATFDPIRISPSFNYAAQVSLKGNIKKTGTSFGLKGEAVSSNFISAGNIFLRSGLANYTAEIKQSMVKNKVVLSSTLSHNFQGFDGKSPQLQYIVSTTTASIRAASFATYVVSYSLFKQLPYLHSISSSTSINHTAMLQQQYTYKIKKTRFQTALNTTYNTSAMTTGETSVQSFNLQNSLTNDIFFSNGILWHVGAGLSYMNNPFTNKLTAGYWTETGNSFVVKKILTLSYQARFSRDGVTPDNIRATASASISIVKSLKLMLKGSYTAAIHPDPFIPIDNTNVTAGINYNFSISQKSKNHTSKNVKKQLLNTDPDK